MGRFLHNPVLVVRRLAKAVNERNPLTINWVAGHVNISGNETADRLAKTGARASINGNGISSDILNQMIARNLFTQRNSINFN